MTPGRSHFERALVAALVLLGEVSCARKAPGPEECHELAVQWVARERGAYAHRLGALVLEPAADAVLERTTECLTTPYDRELVKCIGSGASPRACFAAFESRRGGTGTVREPLRDLPQ